MLRCLSPLLLFASLYMPFQLHASSFEALLAAVGLLQTAPVENQEKEPTQNATPTSKIYGNIYFSLSMADDMQSNIPRFMMYLMTRYQGRGATEKTPSITVKKRENIYSFLASKKKSTISTLTEQAFSWYVRGEDETLLPFKETLFATMTDPDKKVRFLSSFLESGDWIKIQSGSILYLSKISRGKKEKNFTFTSVHTHNGRHVEADIILSEITHLFMPLTQEEAGW